MAENIIKTIIDVLEEAQIYLCDKLKQLLLVISLKNNFCSDVFE
jgi:hypothetical protein